jgi:2-(1,2-epoxy-1,2-dihydrophenyl)acetyl-CoA isomerase
MQYDTINVTLENNIAIITLNRPDVMNALNAQMRAELTNALHEMGKKSTCDCADGGWAVLLFGAGSG